MNKISPIQMRDFYLESQAYLQSLALAESIEDYFATYVDLIKKLALPDDLILDLGCGTGYSALLLSHDGHRIVGSDLSPLFLGQRKEDRLPSTLHLVAADAFQLPYLDAVFDIVTSFQFIEHVPDVPQVLDEMARVLKPGGTLVVVGPNLLSPIHSLKAIKRFLLGHTDVPWWGTIKSYSSPFGNSLPQILWQMLKHTLRLARKVIARGVHFGYREPDLDSGVGGDADSCYWANPVDLKRYLQQYGWCIVTSVAGQSRILGPFASNIQIVARKQENQR